MKLFRVFYTFIIILFVFIGNIGVNVYTHSCDEDGEFRSLVFKVKHNCEHEDEKSSCCSENTAESDCCTDDVNFYKIKFDYFDNPTIQIPPLALSSYPQFEYSIVVASLELDIQKKYPTRPPPKPSGKEILCLNQVFRI